MLFEITNGQVFFCPVYWRVYAGLIPKQRENQIGIRLLETHVKYNFHKNTLCYQGLSYINHTCISISQSA